MAQSDALHRFVFEGLAIRGELAHLGRSWRSILERRHYPPALARLLGQAMAAAPLLMGTLKLTGKLSLQIESGGPFVGASPNLYPNHNNQKNWPGFSRPFFLPPR